MRYSRKIAVALLKKNPKTVEPQGRGSEAGAMKREREERGSGAGVKKRQRVAEGRSSETPTSSGISEVRKMILFLLNCR